MVPNHIERNDFFSSLYHRLEENDEITNLTAVPDAYVPVINFSFCGIQIDLLFARLGLSMIPEDLDLSDINILKNVDEKSVLSLNGCRVTDQLLKLVPNISNFRLTLRAIKYWAQRKIFFKFLLILFLTLSFLIATGRKIYANVYGYLGGVSWALLVARICQLYPNALPSTLVSRFFRVFDQWKWPNPVVLNNIVHSSLGLKVWNPKLYPKDRSHLMPIITPAYPAMNSTYNVSESTLDRMKTEFNLAFHITSKIERDTLSWSSLFDSADASFFTNYKAYVCAEVTAKNEDEHRKW